MIEALKLLVMLIFSKKDRSILSTPFVKASAGGLWYSKLTDNQKEFFEERAAIAQFEAGLNETEAEIHAYFQTLKYFELEGDKNVERCF
jgi:hypothetical protein